MLSSLCHRTHHASSASSWLLSAADAPLSSASMLLFRRLRSLAALSMSILPEGVSPSDCEAKHLPKRKPKCRSSSLMSAGTETDRCCCSHASSSGFRVKDGLQSILHGEGAGRDSHSGDISWLIAGRHFVQNHSEGSNLRPVVRCRNVSVSSCSVRQRQCDFVSTSTSGTCSWEIEKPMGCSVSGDVPVSQNASHSHQVVLSPEQRSRTP